MPAPVASENIIEEKPNIRERLIGGKTEAQFRVQVGELDLPGILPVSVSADPVPVGIAPDFGTTFNNLSFK